MDAITSPPIQDTLPPPAPTSVPLAFTGHRPEFRRLVTHGALLELLTLGFYRFWLATNMRRHLWSHTEIDGDAPEYNGTARELLIGFLFALAVLAPLYLGYFLLGLEAERLQALASFPLVLLFYLFSQFALYRARRYRLTRTVWRGVRFGLGGSGLSYMWRAALWTLLTGVTLGLALPWRQAALERFKMRHTSYGDLPGRFDGTGGQLFRHGWPLWLAAVLLAVAAMTVGVAMAGVAPALAALVPVFVLMVGAIAAPVIYGRYKAIEWRWWVSGVRFGEARFESTLPEGGLTGLYWKVLGWSVVAFVVLLAWFGAILAIGIHLHGGFDQAVASAAAASQTLPVWLGMVAGYLATILAFGVVMRLYLTHDIWVRVARSTMVHNIDAAQATAAHGGVAGAIGEGFADSLDIGGF